ncbi:tetratricopeptide repeat protein [Oceanospirillum multiglobuliferum]|uniref:tetratricopeptide repeat protein n=1 Tax=Oceanospirillum multiglobuliferum TaxID=64969 RepID=UPI0009997634
MAVVVTRRNNLAINYYSQGQYQKSEEQMLLALKIRAKRLGEDHPYTQSSRQNLAAIQVKLAQTRH